MTLHVTYDDVLLKPQYSDIESRKEIILSSNLDKKRVLDIPIISSPMDTVTEVDMAHNMGLGGGLGVLHRYNSIEEQSRMVSELYSSLPSSENWLKPNVAAAIGVTGDFLERAAELVRSGVSTLCIDVAHGHHVLVKKAIKAIKSRHGHKIHIMAGNVATAQGYYDLSKWGADSIRCNVGGGSICSTRVQTGHGVPGLHTIVVCAQVKKEQNLESKIIADGGVRSSGDIVKALAAGANFVMLGSLLAGTQESPGDAISTKEGKFKVYRGMASKEAQIQWKGAYSSNEGISAMIPHKGTLKYVLNDLKNGIASGLSYSGARNILELQNKAQFIRQTVSSRFEGVPHITGKNNAK
jgi:IMP dehydrogenase